MPHLNLKVNVCSPKINSRNFLNSAPSRDTENNFSCAGESFKMCACIQDLSQDCDQALLRAAHISLRTASEDSLHHSSLGPSPPPKTAVLTSRNIAFFYLTTN